MRRREVNGSIGDCGSGERPRIIEGVRPLDATGGSINRLQRGIVRRTVHHPIDAVVPNSDRRIDSIVVQERPSANVSGFRIQRDRTSIGHRGVQDTGVAPQDTREATFPVDEPGVYWIYCTDFCTALHLEMRSRMIVEPSD